MRLLIIEDELRIASFLTTGLRAEGYVVEHAATGREGLAHAEADPPDLIILDLGLPDLDGTEVLRELREKNRHVPVIVLTARGELEDRIESLDLGADDYMSKPFAFEELLARVRARLRRDDEASAVLEAGGVTLDLKRRRATANGREVDLSAREFALLETFLRHPDQVLSREQLLSSVWGFQFDPGSNVVDVYVRYLRRKLGPERIETVRGMGYRLASAGT